MTITASDATGRSANKQFTLYVDTALAVSTTALNTGLASNAYSHTLAATGGYGAKAWSITSGTLPSGLTLDPVSGIISGTPTGTATASLTLQVADSVGRTASKALFLNVTTPLTLTTASLPAAYYSTPYSNTLATSGGVTPFTFSVTGSFPNGVTLNASSGVISGTTTVSGTNNVSITVTDASYPTPQTSTVPYSLLTNYVVPGTCGSSNGGTFTVVPASNLCSQGTATTPTGTGPWSWDCAGLNAGSTVNCSALIKTYSVSATAGSNGTLDGSTPSLATINHGSTTSFKFNANSGYYVSAVSGCGGASYSNGDQSIATTTYTTGAVTGVCTVSSTFAVKTYAVTFSSNGGSAVTSQTINHGNSASQPSAPIRTGYTFSGWYSDAGLTAPFSFATPITGTTSLYAGWTLNSYSVTAIAGSNGALDGTTPSPATVSHFSSTSFKFNATSGYYISAVSGCSGTTYSNSDQSVATTTYTTGAVTGVCSVSSTFAVKTYAVSFSSNGGSAVTSQTINHGNSASQPVAPTRTGYTFSGWYSDAALTTPFSFATPITSTTSLYAGWTLNAYSVTAIASSNGTLDDTTPSPATINHGSTTSFKFNATSGYYVSAVSGCGGTAYSNSSQSVDTYTYSTGPVAGVCTVTAVFAQKWFTVTFAAGSGGSVTGTSPQTITPGGSTAMVGAVVASGYHFINWSGTGGFVTTTANPLTVANVQSAMTITANFLADTTIINGACGSSNGSAAAIKPTANLCSAGVESAVTGSGPWLWSCTGLNTGTTATCSANLDNSGPVIVPSILADGAVTNNPTLNVTGTVSDTSGVASVTVNDTTVTLANGTFSQAVSLQAGANAITVLAADTVGNQSSNSRTITLDAAAPTLTVTTPSDNSLTNNSNATVTGTVSETGTVQVRINDGSWQTAQLNGTDFTVPISLVAGQNTIEVTATDTAGNIVATTAKRTVTYDNAAPNLAITNPAHDITTAQSSVLLSGTVNDSLSSATVSISHDGANFTPQVTNGTFSQQLDFSTARMYPIVVTATDYANNSSAVTRNVIFAPYAVNFAAGNGGSISGTASQTVTEGNSASPVTAVPGTGFHFINWTGTNGFTTTSSNPLVINNVTNNLTIVANFSATPVNSACGSSSGAQLVAQPVTGLCAIGTSSAVTGTGPWGWSCADSSGGAPAVCLAYPTNAGQPVHTGIINTTGNKTAPDISDALAVLKYVAGIGQLTPLQLASVDVAPLNNVGTPVGNGTVDLADVIMILRRSIGIGAW